MRFCGRQRRQAKSHAKPVSPICIIIAVSMHRLFNLITYVFFPGTMAVAGFLVPLLLFPPVHLPWHFWPTIIFFYAIFPVLGILLLVKLGYLQDLHIYERKKRNMSYPIAITGAILGLIYIQNLDSVKMGYTDYALKWSPAIALALILLWLVNAYWLKASAHMCGASGFLAACVVLNQWGWRAEAWVFNALVISVLVYVARRGLSAHSHIELLTGTALGFITTFAVLSL